MEEQIKKIVETAIEKINEAKDASILNDLRFQKRKNNLLRWNYKES